MDVNRLTWKKQDCWGLKEFLSLLLLEFVFVIGCIKFIIQPIYVDWLENDLYALTLMGLTIALTLMLGVYFIALRPKNLSWSEVGVKKIAVQDWKVIFVYSVIVIIVAVLFVVVTSFIGDLWENSKTEAMQQNKTFYAITITFISAAIISPIYEEIFYRGFIYRWLRTRMGFTGAVLLSSIIFTVAHIPTYNVMPVNFFSGVMFALAYERTNSILPSIIIHGSTNGIMVLLTNVG